MVALFLVAKKLFSPAAQDASMNTLLGIDGSEAGPSEFFFFAVLFFFYK